jgi:hypothetical protein
MAMALLLSGCISYTDKPTQLMVDQQLRKTKKLVSFHSNIAALELKSRALNRNCGTESKTLTTLQPTGSGFVGVTSKYDYSVDHGVWRDGTMWVALRTDGLFHGTPIGYRLSPAPEGTDVTVYAADKRKNQEIKEQVEAGSLFCDWGKYSYPYD